MSFGLLPRTGNSDEYKLVGFVVGGVRYGVDIMRVREIVVPAEFVSIPAGPSYVLGVADHRNEAVPIVDLRLRFGLSNEELTKRSKWVLAMNEGRSTALLVDYVTEVIRLTEDNKRDRHTLLAHEDSPWVGDVFADTKGLIFELNLSRLVDDVTLPESGIPPGD